MKDRRKPSPEAKALAIKLLREVQVGHELWRTTGIALQLDDFAAAKSGGDERSIKIKSAENG